MITDNNTNFVYFSEIIINYKDEWNSIEQILNKHNINYALLKNTEDIWARDYMPIQTDTNKFIQFRYEPPYLKGKEDIRSSPQFVCSSNYITPEYSNINLDGGNIIKGKDKVLITDRIYSENPEYSDKKKLVSEIEKLLNAEVIIIPQIKSDFTGHADGLVKFLDDKTIIGNDRNVEFDYWTKGINKVLKEHNLEYVDMPMFEHKDKKYKDSAIGCYMNYLEIGNLIIFPTFQIKGNLDREALNIIRKYYPNKIIEEININKIANYGGLMNCISWNIRLNKMANTFVKNPDGWGLRGDPQLWKEMQEYLLTVEEVDKAGDFKNLLHETFKKLTGQNIMQGKEYYIRRYNSGGMSSGFVSCDYWLDTAIPTLIKRFNENKE